MKFRAAISQGSRVAFTVVVLAAAPGLWAFEPPEKAIQILKPGGSYLGIGVAEVDSSERARALKLQEERGVEVTRVEDDSPAAKGGIRPGDVVLEYNGQRVEGMEQFMRLVRETPPGRDVKLTVSRDGNLQTLSVKTGTRKLWMSRSSDGTIEIPGIVMPEIRVPDIPKAYLSWRNSVLGIEGEALDVQLAEYFGVKEGILVRSVAKGSPAERAGFRAGDVILKVDEAKVATPREISSTLRAARSKKSVPVQLVRERKEMTLTLLLDDNSPDALPRSVARPR
jgi:serine protease Do